MSMAMMNGQELSFRIKFTLNMRRCPGPGYYVPTPERETVYLVLQRQG